MLLDLFLVICRPPWYTRPATLVPYTTIIRSPVYRFAILDAEEHELPVVELCDIVLRLPLAPGCLPALWRRHGHFQDAYLSQHPGYYTTGDAGLVDDRKSVG